MAPAFYLMLTAVFVLFGSFGAALAYALWSTRGMDVVRVD